MHSPESKLKPLLFSVLLLTGFFVLACSSPEKQNQSSLSSKSETKSHTASTDTSKQKLIDALDFTLKDRSGDSFTLSEHEGQVVVLNVWAPWCGPCRKEIPDFVNIQKKLRDEGVLFVGVSVDKEGWSVVRPFAKKHKINYPIVVDDGTINHKYGPFRGIPTTFIINKKGKIRYAATGMIDGQALQPVLKKLASE